MRSFLIATLLLAPALATADTPAPAAPTPTRAVDAVQMKQDDCARARKQNKTCVLDMGKEDIEGTVKTPTGTGVGIVTFGTHTSLIRVRKDFIVEILKSAEDID